MKSVSAHDERNLGSPESRAASVTDISLLRHRYRSYNVRGTLGDSPIVGENKTFRTVQGLEGGFELLDRTIEWDASLTYGRAETESVTRNIKDVEFALAIDAA